MQSEHTESVTETHKVEASAVANPVEQAFEVLADSLEGLISSTGRYPTASEVRLEMKRRTYGGFDPKGMGYKRFRDFLEDAQSHGVVKLDPSRAGDIAVFPSHVYSATIDHAPSIRRDVWKAFVDWTPDRLRFFDLTSDRALSIPSRPAPLEPKNFQDVRVRRATHPEEFIDITPIDVQQQIAWMREWSSKIPDPQVQVLLQASLDADKPVKAFNAILRGLPENFSAGWKREFQEDVRQKIINWQSSDPRASKIAIYRKEQEDAPKPNAEVSIMNPEARPKIQVKSNQVLTNSVQGIFAERILMTTERPSSNVSQLAVLRSRLHSAIDRMPLEEIRKISIPVGYLFED
ncbi:hypothetical protein GCM10010168_83980 [Actinoplanes ianthinogenes]|uniref:HTH OST-type domain-containing protein n=1 Tax=Actinoplanes ianthinogenes TaxID=122358 RepID=A0ABM7M096_9ACTN|nr:UPF0158 family protein [Actinoplanes ianthinogenes]BCJ45028.1 hypothetical protein Aiant_56850 [Actinoplanes ianthinogenes]GGR52327.1 hypothetical protein GCM10010168_83980 [Actinoplanes ianthinogenes]